jgi:hypothetical protein
MYLADAKKHRHNLSQNFKINWVPLIRLGIPWKQTILDLFNYASCGPM